MSKFPKFACCTPKIPWAGIGRARREWWRWETSPNSHSPPPPSHSRQPRWSWQSPWMPRKAWTTSTRSRPNPPCYPRPSAHPRPPPPQPPPPVAPRRPPCASPTAGTATGTVKGTWGSAAAAAAAAAGGGNGEAGRIVRRCCGRRRRWRRRRTPPWRRRRRREGKGDRVRVFRGIWGLGCLGLGFWWLFPLFLEEGLDLKRGAEGRRKEAQRKSGADARSHTPLHCAVCLSCVCFFASPSLALLPFSGSIVSPVFFFSIPCDSVEIKGISNAFFLVVWFLGIFVACHKT